MLISEWFKNVNDAPRVIACKILDGEVTYSTKSEFKIIASSDNIV